MKFNYSGIGKNQQPQTLVDPVDIFRSSTVIDQNVNDFGLDKVTHCGNGTENATWTTLEWS